MPSEHFHYTHPFSTMYIHCNNRVGAGLLSFKQSKLLPLVALKKPKSGPEKVQQTRRHHLHFALKGEPKQGMIPDPQRSSLLQNSLAKSKDEWNIEASENILILRTKSRVSVNLKCTASLSSSYERYRGPNHQLNPQKSQTRYVNTNFQTLLFTTNLLYGDPTTHIWIL